MTKKLIVALSLLLVSGALFAQTQGGLDPATLLKPLSDSWPTYSGDYTGRDALHTMVQASRAERRA